MIIVMKIITATVMIMRCFKKSPSNGHKLSIFVRYLNSSYAFSCASSGYVDGSTHKCTFCIEVGFCVYSSAFSNFHCSFPCSRKVHIQRSFSLYVYLSAFSRYDCSFLCRCRFHMQKSFRLYEHSSCDTLNAVIGRPCNHTSYNHKASLQCDSIYESLTSDL